MRGGNDYTFSLRKCLFGSFPDFESDQRCLEYHQPCCYGFFTARYKQEYTLRRLFSGARFGLPTKMPAEGYIQTAELATWATDANKPERSLEKNMKARFLLVTAFALSFVSQSSGQQNPYDGLNNSLGNLSGAFWRVARRQLARRC